MAAELSVSYYTKLVDVCYCRFIGGDSCFNNSGFPAIKAAIANPVKSLERSKIIIEYK